MFNGEPQCLKGEGFLAGIAHIDRGDCGKEGHLGQTSFNRRYRNRRSIEDLPLSVTRLVIDGGKNSLDFFVGEKAI